ncbi:MAG: rhomboid family intramembrane serine protease [Bacteroidia bacterium]|nr:rhomboid family intramembrane serine protease [Bacteroidia bacterium]MDW8236511.1 rhomboid family intramembrane serine protease [Bacteroidia bacterium]
MVSSYKRFFETASPLTLLIGINAGLYAVAVLVGFITYLSGTFPLFEHIYHKLALPGTPQLLLKQPWSLLTHMFLHDIKSFWHLFFNMLWLFWMGKLFLTTQPASHLYWAYGLGGLGGIIGYLTYAWSHYPYPSYALGASAAVNGVFFATVMLMPHFQVYLLFLGPIALRWLGLIWVFLDMILTLSGNEASAIAHLGGTAAGILFGYLLRQGVDFSSFWSELFQRREVTPEEIDRILEKIHQKGMKSLTRRERELLRRAAERL